MSTETETEDKYDTPLTDIYYIPSIGWFNIEQHFGTIPLEEVTIQDLDLTLALQLKVNVRTFNEKIGLIKDASNNTIIQSSFDSSNNVFSIDDISLNYQDILPDIITDNVISVGGFSSMYRDFKRNVINYYEHADNVSLFNNISKVILDEPEFTKDDFVNIFTNINSDGGYDISGQIYISEVSNTLSNIYINNPFLNRSDKTYEDGFIAGDLVSLSSGISIRLDLLSKIPNPVQDLDYTSDNVPPPILLSKIYTTSLVLHLANL
jgi:hypothetical protein